METNGFPGKRVLAKRAGIIPTATIFISAKKSGRLGLNTKGVGITGISI
jgi:hypothetical protein